MIKHQIFVTKYLPVQTSRNKHLQRTCDLFKLINKGTAVTTQQTFVGLQHVFSVTILRLLRRLQDLSQDVFKKS